jgi:hypothetical protein
MSRPKASLRTPWPPRHRSTGQIVVTLPNYDHYFGEWKSKSSETEHDMSDLSASMKLRPW